MTSAPPALRRADLAAAIVRRLTGALCLRINPNANFGFRLGGEVIGPRLLSQLAHVEMVSPTASESLRFYTEILGLEESGSSGASVYLRGWGDWFHHTLQLTEGPGPALGHIAWRAAGPEQLEQAVALVEAAGLGEGWIDAGPGHGPAYRYRSPGGHLHEVFWEVERFKAPAGSESSFPNRPQRFDPRGAAARCLDHVTIAASDPASEAAWYRDTLGHRYMEYTVAPDAPDHVVFAMTTVCERAHDLGIVWDPTPARGRVNHLSYWVASNAELVRAADVFLNAGVEIEFGPGRHGMGEQDYLYVREPSGMRVELNSGGYRNYEPDWEPVRFEPAQGSNVFFRNLAMPHSMFECFPPAAVPGAPPEGAIASTGLFN
ncbi:MAG TPA: VOC family protein [Solirubrobacteraceae bacterium]|jgi:catechol 2,3-dioxygenase